MITLFIIIGLALLGGGLATIVDGLPYLVLERGFTQVLGGVTAATGGLVILGLAWVLIEIRRLRTALRTGAPVPAEATRPLPDPVLTDVAPEAAPLGERAEPDFGRPGTGAAGLFPLGPLGAGAGAALGAGVVAMAGTASPAPDATKPEGEPARPEPEVSLPPEPESLASAPMEPLPLQHDENRDAPDLTPEPEPSPQPEPSLDEPEPSPEPEPEMYREPKIEREPEMDQDRFAPADGWAPASWPEAAAPSRASDPFAEAIAAAMRPHEDELPQPAEETVDRAEGSEDRRPDPQDFDGLDLLRKSFADPMPAAAREGHDAGPEPEPREEAEPEPEPADAWMLAVRRDESWLTSLPSVREEPAPPASEQVTIAPSRDHAPPVAPEPAPEPEPEPVAEEAPEPVAEPAATADEQPGRDDAPASSDEGVIGAYQVGDAHFTIYSDGSIRARTPDGDYDFASMDELKAYLASEKSRLGL